jgi:hypothetical protein
MEVEMLIKMSWNPKKLVVFALAVIVLFSMAQAALVVQAQPAEKAAPKAATYEAVLGKSLADPDVADFIASNHCSSTGQFKMCNDAGIALWTSQGQKVETVYLYPNKIADFAAYKGTLPFALSASDTMANVEDKFGHSRMAQVPQAGWEPGLPDATGTPDHVHYWAVYRRFGVTIVYNSPSATNQSASIYAILVSK